MNKHFKHVNYFSSSSLTLVTYRLSLQKLGHTWDHLYYYFPYLCLFYLTYFLNLNLFKEELLLQMESWCSITCKYKNKCKSKQENIIIFLVDICFPEVCFLCYKIILASIWEMVWHTHSILKCNLDIINRKRRKLEKKYFLYLIYLLWKIILCPMPWKIQFLKIVDWFWCQQSQMN